MEAPAGFEEHSVPLTLLETDGRPLGLGAGDMSSPLPHAAPRIFPEKDWNDFCGGAGAIYHGFVLGLMVDLPFRGKSIDWLSRLWNSPENIVRIIWLLRRISYDTIHMMIQGSKGHVFHACMKKHDFGTAKT